jgi:hypothetical protein
MSDAGKKPRTWTTSEALEDWRKLGRRQRREVLNLARQGAVRPDRRVAKLAHRWSMAVLPASGCGRTIPRG